MGRGVNKRLSPFYVRTKRNETYKLVDVGLYLMTYRLLRL